MIPLTYHSLFHASAWLHLATTEVEQVYNFYSVDRENITHMGGGGGGVIYEVSR